MRHPDMPPATFEDLWRTLQAGKPWLGLVKNRRKDGGFYWAQAFVAPISENGQITGYSSVRTRPTDAQIQQAHTAYEKINQGILRGYTLQQGQLVRTGWRKYLGLLSLPFQPTLAATAFRLTVVGLLGLGLGAYLAFINPALAQGTYAYGLMGLFALLALLLCLMSWRLARQAIHPLQQASDIAQQIAAGNLVVDTDSLEQQHSGHSKKLFFIKSRGRASVFASAWRLLLLNVLSAC